MRPIFKKESYFFKGHFPNNPIVPGVIIVEALAQTAGVVSGLEFEKENGVKPNEQQKEALLQGLLADRVFLRGEGYSGRPVPISAVNTNQMKKVFVKVGNERIFMKDIPDFQEKEIIKELNKANIPVTQYKIAEYWLKAGKPKTDSLVETTQGIGEIKGPTYGMMAG